MKRIWLVGVLIAFSAVAKFGYDYFYFDTDLSAKPVATASATPSASPSPSETPTTPPVPPTKVEVQQALADMAIPVGAIDGKWGARTRQALCIWRELTRRDINRNFPTTEEQFAIVAQEDLTLPNDFVMGLNVNKSCQSVVWVKDKSFKNYEISIVSTGAAATPTDNGTFKVTWRVNRWYESISIPDGWMYKPMFFNKGQAIHGSEKDAYVWWYPASHGCVRMLHAFVDALWASDFGIGSTVRVYGYFNPYTTDPVI
jgi:lipoprotein-anchoring transpeptidase ErfK/SrfK